MHCASAMHVRNHLLLKFGLCFGKQSKRRKLSELIQLFNDGEDYKGRIRSGKEKDNRIIRIKATVFHLTLG